MKAHKIKKPGRQMAENDGGMPSVFSFLPEGCISEIIALTSPKDAARASVISQAFKSASESDTVWETFLPCDYLEIISNSVHSPVNYATKRDLYFSLCNSPIIIDDGKMSFWLSKSSGKKCYMLSAKELSIAWKDTPVYWIWKSIPESRFAEVGELKFVCWLDIQGKMNTQMLSLKTVYSAYLVFRITEDSYGLDYVAKASVRFAEGAADRHHESSLVLLAPEARASGWGLWGPRYETPEHQQQRIDARVPQQRRDGWMEIFLGEFFNDEGDHGDIEMQLWETEILNGKRGLILEGIELRPKEDAI